MYLKNIEVQGFKSFAQKINFEFHNGITGIVGPNGSGKSNVGDAVRWVLGEQSAKQLRGGNMQDVIFSGTELRKPLSFASVAITLDNSDHKLPVDFEEVTVTRRLYRSGESEYRINGSSCRLKEWSWRRPAASSSTSESASAIPRATTMPLSVAAAMLWSCPALSVVCVAEVPLVCGCDWPSAFGAGVLCITSSAPIYNCYFTHNFT